MEKEKSKQSKRSDQARLTRKKSVFNFNHINRKNKERMEELQKLFKFYHKFWYCYKKVHSRAKKINLYLNLVSVPLVSIGTIVGGLTMNPVILGAVAAPGIVLKTTMEMKNLSKRSRTQKWLSPHMQKFFQI